MFEKLKEIIEGHRNHLLPPKRLKELINEVSKNRLTICVKCNENSSQGVVKAFSYCKACGCPLIQKSKSLQSACPKNFWPSITTPEEEHQIKLKINGEKNSQEGPPVETSDSN